MIAYIDALPLADREALKEQVDWVEGYNTEDQRLSPAAPLPSSASASPAKR